ncbi:hypothetical protein J437_LFUL018968 [Ladona fulva]|nr:hypothetical protein J437_LFUL018968 [Ladona fulva]
MQGSAILFCVSPASIFFTAPYSETLFALLTFHGMLQLADAGKEILWSSIPFGLSTSVRSNGLISAGFLIHSEAQAIVNVAQTSNWFDALFKSFKSSLRLLLGILLLVAPFATFQVYAVVKFCNPNGDVLPDFLISYSSENDLVVPGIGNPPAWCNSSTLPYTAVQSQYWNVGFLRYFQWKQLPNFILAAPMFILILRGSLQFFKQHKELCYNLGLWKSKTNLKRRSSQSDVLQSKAEECKMLEFPPEIFVYIAHVLSLLLFCFFFIHIQVTTRLIASASPVPYWFAAYFLSPFSAASFSGDLSNPSIQNYELNVESERNLCSIWRVFVISDWAKHPVYTRMSPLQKNISQVTKQYFISFAFIGTVLFSNNLPWT